MDSPNEVVRSTAYRLYHRPDPHQEELLSELLLSRARLAGLCGYNSFGHRALAESLAGDPESVAAFLRRLGERIRPSLETDFQAMLGMKRRFNAGDGQLQVWDVPYLASKVCIKIYRLLTVSTKHV